jgi:hypothetical protein
MGARAGNPICAGFTGILETELDVIQASGDKFIPSRLGKSDSRRDQIRVESATVSAAHQSGQIFPG